jgi:hypothetical protein
MLSFQSSMRDQRGMVLFISLTLLSLLMALAVGSLVAVQNDFKITSNLRAATVAFYLADSGIEWAKEQIDRTVTNPPVVRNGSQSFFSGSFAVSFSAPTKLTPLRSEVNVRSLGRLGNATQLIQARVSKTYELADAALALRGQSRGVHFDGDSFLISGQDHDPASGLPVGGRKPRPAVSVASPVLALEVGRTLGPAQTDNIIGAHAAAGIRQSDRLPADMLERVAADLCGSPAAQNIPVPMTGLPLTDQSWGNRLSPELRCINGVPGNSDVVTVTGNVAGAGILIIRDAGFIALGSFRWEGLIVVSGANVGFEVDGAQNTEVVGALVINETAAGSGGIPPTLHIRGAVRILYSNAALNAASNLIPAPVLAASYPALPYSITQNYWRAVAP